MNEKSYTFHRQRLEQAIRVLSEPRAIHIAEKTFAMLTEESEDFSVFWRHAKHGESGSVFFQGDNFELEITDN